MNLKDFPFFNTDEGRYMLDLARAISLEELMGLKVLPDERHYYVATQIFIMSMYGNPKYDKEVEHLQYLRDNLFERKGMMQW